MQPQLLSLMGRLPDQPESVYNLLKQLEERVRELTFYKRLHKVPVTDIGTMMLIAPLFRNGLNVHVFQASILIQHICKAGNGSIPKPPKKQTSSSSSKKGRDKGGGHQCVSATVEPSPGTSEKSAEERLARYLLSH